MRSSELPSAFGALGQRTERRMLSLIIQLSRESGSARHTRPSAFRWPSDRRGQSHRPHGVADIIDFTVCSSKTS